MLKKKKPVKKQLKSSQPRKMENVSAAVLANNTVAGEAQASNNFKGCCIQPGDPAKACEAVLALGDQTFAANMAPELPLRRCDVESCSCQYVPFNDRRKSMRRHNQDRRENIRMDGDRRNNHDRRKGADSWKNTV
jgi:hypothetical protein